MQKKKLSYCEAARQFDISDHHNVARRERIYLEEGAEGLQIERCERKTTGRPVKLEKKVEEELIAEVQRLRAENAYLRQHRIIDLNKNRKRKALSKNAESLEKCSIFIARAH